MIMQKLYHIGLSGDIKAKYAILTGDPNRVEKIAKYLNNPRFLESRREYTSYCGSINGEDVIVMSTGIGGPSAAIAAEELYKAGVQTFIRVGTCGGLQIDVQAGDIVIPSGAIRMEGTSREYLPIEYPALADYHVVNALVQAADNIGKKYHIGVIQSKDSFYGQHEPDRMPVSYNLKNKWDAWIKAGCLASEMECAALFTVSGVLRARCGAVLHVVWNQERQNKCMSNIENHDMHYTIKTAVDAMQILIKNDM
jgi:uridine phosphorylase